jgi:hypothetical protein
VAIKATTLCASDRLLAQEPMECGMPDVPKIAPIIEIKESYFHRKQAMGVCQLVSIAPALKTENPGNLGYRGFLSEPQGPDDQSVT